MLECTEHEGIWSVYELMDNCGDISNDFGDGETPELAWRKAAEFLNDKLNELRKVINKGMWDGLECDISFYEEGGETE